MQRTIVAPISVKSIIVNGYSLLTIRLWFYSLAFLHVLVLAIVTLSIDLTVDEDPKVRIYSRLRWYLLTCWFNLMFLFYTPLCVYCDYQEMFKKDTIQLKKLRRIRDNLMTTFLFPVTAYADITFWIFYNMYPDAIAPPNVITYLPTWAQHSLHTVSLGFVIMDLVLTPRQRPTSFRGGLVVLNGFIIMYTLFMYVNYLRGEIMYAFLATSSRTVCIMSFLWSLCLTNICYYAQWFIINCVWRRKPLKVKN